MTLGGRTILVTRRHEQAGEVVREIEARGGRAVVIPMIVTEPPRVWTECDAAIGRLETYDILLFTSANAVESFVGRARTLGVSPGSLSRLPAAAVGKATAAALKGCGLEATVNPGEFTGASLAQALGRPLSGKRVLIPQGNIARGTLSASLRENGAVVDTVTVYVTSKPEGTMRENFVRRVLSGEFDVVTFASPSAVANFGSLFPAGELSAVADHARIAVIGPTTEEAVRELGLAVDVVARESTACGLVAAIEEFFR
jgi:uroporphyrinogen-III synthase